MTQVTLGSTGITVEKNGFGALPIQRVDDNTAVKLLQKAYDGGINFYDTARLYTDSEHKIGKALKDVRDKIIIASKSASITADKMISDLETSLRELKTDYIDIYQFHNPDFCPKPYDESGLYDAALEAKKQGKIRHIGITNHRLKIAKEAIESGLYETMQFPFCYLTTEKELEILDMASKHNMGFIGMKSLSGGLITNSRAAYAFSSQFDNLVPIWGIQRESELDEFLSYVKTPPAMDDEIKKFIEREKAELQGNFCRGCGYCLPCPANIEIFNCARMTQLIRRSPSEKWLLPANQDKMMKIKDCINCGHCKNHCPYGLDTPNLLKKNLEDYENILSGKVAV